MFVLGAKPLNLPSSDNAAAFDENLMENEREFYERITIGNVGNDDFHNARCGEIGHSYKVRAGDTHEAILDDVRAALMQQRSFDGEPTTRSKIEPRVKLIQNARCPDSRNLRR